MTMTARYAVVLGGAVLAALLPGAGPNRLWLVLGIVAIAGTYNAIYDVFMRRTGVLPLAMAYTDQVLTVGIVFLVPHEAEAVLLVMAGLNAITAISLGRRVAGQAAALGAVGVGIALLLFGTRDELIPYLVYLLASTFIIIAGGSVSEVERTVRDRYTELVGGIDAIVWEQLTRQPSTLYVNEMGEKSLGYPRSAWREPGFWGRLVHPDDRSWAGTAYHTAIAEGRNLEIEYRVVASDGRVLHVRDHMRVETDSEGRAEAVRGVALDVTERVMAVEVLQHQALHDGLTGLPNRTMLNDRLRQALARSQGDRMPIALLVMDLDQFKEVNDALGHHHGDQLLIEMSRRLQRVLHDVDLVSRLGGDEFAVLLVREDAPRAALAVAKRIRTALEQPFQLGRVPLQTKASIGIALHPTHAADAETLVQRADVAMYTAKRAGEGIAVYSPEHDQSSVRRLTLLGELRRAIDDGRLRLHYQPMIDLTTGKVTGSEALVRWAHPELGLMFPTQFIELAELSGAIGALTRWVLESAVVQMVAWHEAGVDLSVSVNLSVRNLYEPDLVRWLAELLRNHGMHPSRIQLELTESQVMEDPNLAMEVLGRLRALGVAVIIDDFGTGYSSLAYLKNLPIDQLKIDRSFVGNMARDESDLAIVRSTIDLSHRLGLSVVAEGVEDGDTLRLLTELGCDRAQGFFLSEPVSSDQLVRWLGDPIQRQRLKAFVPSDPLSSAEARGLFPG